MIQNPEVERAEPSLLIRREESVTWVTLNRPHQANALTLPMMVELWHIWEDFDRDSDQRVLVLTGAGTRFCAGRDLGELAESKGHDARILAELRPAGAPENWFFRLLPDVTKPTICAVNGAAVGGGFALMQRCDLRIAVDTANLSINEIVHGYGAGNFLVEFAREIPPALVTEMVQLGESITASRAYEVGLINRVVAADQLLPAAEKMARRLAEFSPLALRTNKEAIVRSRYPDQDVIWSYAQHAFDRLRRH